MSALELPCESCGKRTPHKVVKTHSSTFFWSEHHSEYFESMFGSDLLYRARDRSCEACGAGVRTVEHREDVLASLIGELDRLNGLLKSGSQQPEVSTSRYFPGAVHFVAEVFGRDPAGVDPRLTWQEADRVLTDVSQFLDQIEPDLAEWVRFRYHLWDAPTQVPAPATTEVSRLAMLRHPSRSQALKPAVDTLFPTT